MEVGLLGVVMSLVENRNRRTLFLSVLCLACWQCVEFSLASAQERSRPSTPAGSPGETSSQRLLPLPAGASADLKQQVQWLQQLQRLMAAGSLGSDTSETPKMDPEQLNALLSAMKQFTEALPQGTVLPKSDSHSSEQLFKMMSDPALQEQMRQLLEQFSQNGKLPPVKETADSKSVPLPSASTPRSAGPAQELPAMPPAAQEWMKRLFRQAGRQPNEPPNDGKSGDQKLKPANPDRERVEPNVPAPADKPKQFDTSPKDVSKPSRSQPDDQIREPPTTTPPSKQSVTPQNSSNSPKSPQMDVRSELQEKGFTQTLRKLIDQSREASRAESNGSAGTSAGGQDPGNGSLSGLEKSIIRLIDGLREDSARQASQVPAQTPSPMPAGTAIPQPSTPPSEPERRSTAGKVVESLGNVFKEMTATPDAQPGNARPRQGRSSSGVSDSQRMTSRSTGPLLMLLAALGLVWYFLPRVLTSVKESHLSRRSSSVGEVTPSADIRTREDVVRAFHQYALQSAMSVPSWWTHREVERRVADTTPALQPSIQVLADLYELARYLPGEAELTPDQIGIARRELENVSQSFQVRREL